MFGKRFSSALVLVAILALLVTSARFAKAQDSSGQKIEGSWVATVFLNNPPPFLPSSFTALETYSRGGGIVTSNNLAAGPRIGQGAWDKEGRQFDVGILFLILDQNGAQTGTIKVRHSVTLNGKDEYSGEGVAEIRDTAENLLATVSFTSEGRRIKPE
jgi:hypothetical protein